MTRAREAARLIGNNTFRLDSNNAVGFNSTTPDAMFDINSGLTVAGVLTATSFSGTVTNATNVTVADESSDTTCFPLFVTAATGNLAPKSGSNLTFNSSTGTLETTNVTVTGDLTVQGTTTTLDTTLQEVDLINVQANASVPGLGVTQSGSGAIIAAYDGASEVFRVDDGGSVGVGTDNPGAQSSSANNLVVADFGGEGGITIKNANNSSGNIFFADQAASAQGRIQYNHTNDYLRFYTNGDNERLRITSGGDVGIGTNVPARLLHLHENSSDGTLLSFTNATTGSGGGDGAVIGIQDDESVIISNKENNHIELHTNNTERIRITSAGNVSIQNDSGKFTAGASDDLQIYHDGSNSYTDNTGVGHFYIRNTVDNKDVIIQSDNGSGSVANYVVCNGATGVTALYHYGNQKLATSADGVDFGGTGSIKVPVGTTAERPTGTAGDFRYNSTTGGFEGYTTEWGEIAGGGGGITTAFSSPSGITTHVFLSDAQDHKLTCSGITTISCAGGVEGESHTVRIINSGITTVGFSTFFLFPSGAAPSLPTADGAISLISFTVNRVGAAGTQLLAGASVNFS